MKILIPVDGSTYSRAAAAYVARLAGTFAEPVEVHLLHVHAPLPYPIAASAVGHKVVADYQRETSQEALGVAEAELRKAGVAYRSTWCVGDVAEEVARFVATHSIELVVCGSHGNNAFVNLALGSAATRLIATVPAPVLVVTRAAIAAQRLREAA